MGDVVRGRSTANQVEYTPRVLVSSRFEAPAALGSAGPKSRKQSAVRVVK